MSRYLPQLDGLRTLAVFLVISVHSGVLGTGYVGVDVFFVLSGYLITTILLEQRASGRWNLRAFYGRRMRRLYPALIAMLVLTLPVDQLFIQGTFGRRMAVVGLTAAYLSDFVDGIKANWLDGLSHTWSLAVEEQFYLLWPLALIAVAKHRHGIRVLIGVTTVMLVALSLGPESWMFLPFTRGGVLLLGCLLAFWLPGKTVSAILAPASVALLILVLAIGPHVEAGQPHAGAAAALAGVASVGVLAGIINGGRIARLLSLAPLVWVGQRSYAIYLWHVPIVVTLIYAGYTSPWPDAAVTTFSAILLAALSYRFVESRFWRRSVGPSREPTVPASRGAVQVADSSVGNSSP